MFADGSSRSRARDARCLCQEYARQGHPAWRLLCFTPSSSRAPTGRGSLFLLQTPAKHHLSVYRAYMSRSNGLAPKVCDSCFKEFTPGIKPKKCGACGYVRPLGLLCRACLYLDPEGTHSTVRKSARNMHGKYTGYLASDSLKR